MKKSLIFILIGFIIFVVLAVLSVTFGVKYAGKYFNEDTLIEVSQKVIVKTDAGKFARDYLDSEYPDEETLMAQIKYQSDFNESYFMVGYIIKSELAEGEKMLAIDEDDYYILLVEKKDDVYTILHDTHKDGEITNEEHLRIVQSLKAI